MDLEELLIGLKSGCPGALEEIYRTSKRAVYVSAFAVLRNHADTEDIMQDTYLRIAQSVKKYRPKGKPLAWICTIAKNLALNALKNRKRFVPLDSLSEQPAPAAEESAGIMELAAQVLSEKELEAVLLKTCHGFSHKEIADLTKEPYATVRWRYHISIEKLKHYIEKENITL